MKIAYCIICHKYTPVLHELVTQLEPDGDVYLHIDAKADPAPFAPLAGHVELVPDRVLVNWGTFSQIEASLRSMKATCGGNYDYIAIISGDTLPLCGSRQISRFLELNAGKEFIFLKPLQPHHAQRLKYKYPDYDIRERGVLRKIWAALQNRLKLYPRNRYFDRLPPLSFGSNWMIVTSAFRDYIFDYLAANPGFAEAFRYGHCGDELFFATLIENSPFRERRDPRRYMYVDWETGPQYPRTLDESDFGRLAAAAATDTPVEHYIFARKFSDKLDLDAYRRKFIETTSHDFTV